MKFGACIDNSLEMIKQCARGNCEYVELNFALLTNTDEKQYDELKKTLENENIKAKAANCFIPGEYQITGPNADIGPIKKYLEKGLKRAKELGIEFIVFGSGGARNMPKGFSNKEQAFDQCVKFLQEISPIVKEFDIKIVIEPLRYDYNNIINTVAEATKLAKAVDRDNIGVLADLYHILYNDEGMQGVVDAGDLLWHCHIARLYNNMIPLKDDGEDYSIFFDALKKINYDGMMSIEGNCDDFSKQVGESMEVLELLR